MSLRVVFSDDACAVCLTPFAELIDTHKITFAKCQHTMCLPCLTKHTSGTTDVATQTPCCKQPIAFAIQSQDDVASAQTFYKFSISHILGDRLFLAEPHCTHGQMLRSLNENMLKFNGVAEYMEEHAFGFMEVFRSWKQVYFQLPGHGDEEIVDLLTLHLVLIRVKDSQLEFAWTDPRISIARVGIANSVRLPL